MLHPQVLAGAALGAALALARGQVPDEGAIARRPDPAAVLGHDCLVVATTEEAAAWVRSIGGFATPLPEGLDPLLRLRLSAGLAALRAATGCSPGDLVERLAPGPATAGLVLEGGRPSWFAAFAVERSEPVETLLAKIPARHRWHGEWLYLAQDDGLLERLTASPPAEHPSSPPAGSRTAGSRMAGSPTLGAPHLHLEADLAGLRRTLGAARDPIEALDPGARFFVGPWVDAVSTSRRLELDIAADGEGFDVEGRLDGGAGAPWNRLLVRAERDIPAPASLLAWIALDRGLAPLFADLEGFLGQGPALQAQASVAIFDAVLGPARSFEGLLDLLVEPTSLLVLRPAPALADDPRLVLPGLALVAEARGDAERALRDAISRTTGALSLIVNAERRQQNRPGAVVVRGFDDGDGARGVTASLTPWRGEGAPPTEWGVRATVALGEGHLVVASTDDVARQVFEALRAGRTKAIRGDALGVEGAALAELLERNRRRLELDRVLDRGETLEEAAAFWDSAVAVVAELVLQVEAVAGGGTSPVGGGRGSRFAISLTRRLP